MKDITLLAKNIAGWISEQVSYSKTNGVVVGISGGIDSAVTAALSKKALGGNVLGLIMPCESNPFDMECAYEVIDSLELEAEMHTLTDVYDKLVGILPESSSLVRGNLKARLRMMTLYHHAALNNYLVVGTGNKSEEYIGYFTKYGDGGVDILPLGEVTKTDVIALAKHLEIPEKVINRKPTAGLWEGQTDEDEMGFTYNDLDKHLRGEEISYEVETNIELLHKLAHHKLSVPPIYNFSRKYSDDR